MIQIHSDVDFAKNEEKAETSIKLENQELIRANAKLAQEFNPIFGYHHSPSSSHEAVITRLTSIYEDSDYGPGYFRGSAKLLKRLLWLYKDIKTDPTCEMFFLAKNKTGIHIHFNSITKKKEVVIPLGHPGIDPIRINIGKFRSWYKKQRIAAIAARKAKTKKEIMELNVKVAQLTEDRYNFYIDQCQAEKDTKKALLNAYSEREELELIGINKLNDEFDKLNDLHARMEREVSKPKEEYLSTNKDIEKLVSEKGMYQTLYEKKTFLEKILKAMENSIKISNIVRDIYHSFNDEIQLK